MQRILGAIVGDIAGSTYEWRNTKSKDFTMFPPGSRFTDDTVMTLAVAKWLMDDPEHHHHTLVSIMQELGNRFPNAGYGRSFRHWLAIEHPSPYNSWGNGAGMRVSPVGLYAKTLEEALRLAKITAEVTHNHPEGIKGAQAIAAAVWLERQKWDGPSCKKKPCTLDEIKKFTEYNFNFSLDEIRPSYTFDVSCQGSVPQAIMAWREGETFEDVLRNAISIGGDSDTIAAMACGISNQPIPEAWTECCRALLPKDLLQINDDFLRFLRTPWKHSYKFGDGLFGGEYPIDKELARSKRKLKQILNFGITDFIDLTEEDELHPYQPYLPEGVNYYRYPIKDCSAPNSLQEVIRLCRKIAEIERNQNRKLYMHCWGGIGRTGTIVACYKLFKKGVGDATMAIQKLREDFFDCPKAKYRRTPETKAQEEFIIQFATLCSSMTESLVIAKQDRIKGSMFGGAIGDALGYAVEFDSWKGVQRKYGEQGITNYQLNDKGIAEISDDTQMTLFTANGLMMGDTRGCMRGIMGYPSCYVVDAYRDWFRTQTEPFSRMKHEAGCTWLLQIPELWSRRAPGTTCLNALQQIMSGATVRNNSKGCGGVMRVAPVALYYYRSEHIPFEELIKLGGACAEITHHHPLGYIPAAMLVGIIARILRNDITTKQDYEDACKETLNDLYRVYPEHKESVAVMQRLTKRAIEAAHDSSLDDEANIRSIGEGWVGEEALAIAIYCVSRHFGNLEKAIIASVNHSGDSDSTGAICGNIIGTIVGYKAIPKRFLENLELSEVIMAISEDLNKGCIISEFMNEVNDEQRQWYARYCDMEPAGVITHKQNHDEL